MTKQELISYLDAVCDAESAIQACTDAIEVYKNQRAQELPKYKEPEAPILTPDSAPDFYEPGLHWEIKEKFFRKSAFDIFRICYTSAAEAKRRTDSYYECCALYKSQLAIYNANQRLRDDYRSKCDAAIHKQEENLQKAKAYLSDLYGQCVLYPSFRNLIAAYQIREYLQMGICDTLEGPTGAYAQYMNDVRAARICDSITDLKRSLTTAINGLQGTLARELRQIDSNLDGLRSDMNTSVQRLNTQMQQLHNASAAQLDAHFSEANRQLSAINNSLAISEHNRYIERRLNNVDTYLMKLP